MHYTFLAVLLAFALILGAVGLLLAKAERRAGRAARRDVDQFMRAVRDMDGTHALEEVVAHYTDLLSRGYRATRWHHPRFGGGEMMPDGSWKFSAVHPDSPRSRG